MLLNGFLEILVKSSLPFSGKAIIPQIGTGSSGFFDVYKNFPERFLCVNFARTASAKNACKLTALFSVLELQNKIF